MKAGKGYSRNNPGSEVIGSGAKPSKPKIGGVQAHAGTTYSLAQTKQNAGRAIDRHEPRHEFNHTHGRCSACGSMMGGEVLAGLCGLCPPAKLRDFVDRVRGNREANRVQKQMDLL